MFSEVLIAGFQAPGGGCAGLSDCGSPSPRSWVGISSRLHAPPSLHPPGSALHPPGSALRGSHGGACPPCALCPLPSLPGSASRGAQLEGWSGSLNSHLAPGRPALPAMLSLGWLGQTLAFSEEGAGGQSADTLSGGSTWLVLGSRAALGSPMSARVPRVEPKTRSQSFRTL